MDVFEAIKKRFSVRSYRDKEIPEEKLEKVLEAARLAPSGHNAQPWKFVVVKGHQTKAELSRAAGQPFIVQAPVIIVAVALNPDDTFSSGVYSAEVDLAIAVDHMTLVAVEEDLGTCWIGAFSQEEVKRVLEIPEQHKVIALLPLGFPDDKPGPKLRKNLDEIISKDKFK